MIRSAKWWFLTFGVAGVAVAAHVLGGTQHAPVAAVAEQRPALWPQQTSLALSNKQSTLVMFVHPHCPCAQAALAKLSGIMKEDHGRTLAYVMFDRPSDQADEWELGDEWNQAIAIPNTVVLPDPGGKEAKRFGAKTSGEVVVYQPDLSLSFAGGFGEHSEPLANTAIEPELVAKLAQAETRPQGCSLEPQPTQLAAR